MLTTLKKYLNHMAALLEHALRDFGCGVERSPQWKNVQALWVHEHDSCSACGGTSRLVAHHIVPFCLDRSKELDPENLITLCMGIEHHCHLMIGHGADFRAYNPHVVSDSRNAAKAARRQDVAGFELVLDSAKKSRRYEVEQKSVAA